MGEIPSKPPALAVGTSHARLVTQSFRSIKHGRAIPGKEIKSLV
jgi:hypothetical protein